MTLQDPFAHPGRGPARRARRRRGPDLLGPTPQMRPRARRRLAAMESALSRDTPQLASMFDLFTQLTKGEQVEGAERMQAPARRRLQSAHVAVLVTLAAIAALCLVLSTQVRPMIRQCTTSATSATVAAQAADAEVHGLDCAAYPTNK